MKMQVALIKDRQFLTILALHSRYGAGNVMQRIFEGSNLHGKCMFSVCLGFCWAFYQRHVRQANLRS